MTSKLLLAGDDHFFMRRLAPILKARGALVVPVANAGAAESSLQKVEFDLILLDTQLPGANGLGWLQAIRKSGVTSPAGLLLPFWDDPATIHKTNAHLKIAFASHKTASPADVALRIAEATRCIAPGGIPARRIPQLRTA